MPRVHAAIHAQVYIAESIDLYKYRVAVKFKVIKRISKQLLLLGNAVLLPLALQIAFALALQAGIERAGGCEQG